MRVLPILLLLLAWPQVAALAAEPDSLELGTPRRALVEVGLPPRVPSPLDSVPHPWPGIALSLSAVGTALPILVAGSVSKKRSDAALALGIIGAEIVTPGAGHLYAGMGRRAAIGMAWRAVGYGVFAGGCAEQGLWPGQTESSDFTYGVPLMFLGVIIMSTSALVDIITVPGDVDRRNREWLHAHAAVGVSTLSDGNPALAVTVNF